MGSTGTESYTVSFEEADPAVLGVRFSPHVKYAEAVADKFALSTFQVVRLTRIPDFHCTRQTLVDVLRQACFPKGIRVHVRGEDIYLRKEG